MFLPMPPSWAELKNLTSCLLRTKTLAQQGLYQDQRANSVPCQVGLHVLCPVLAVTIQAVQVSKHFRNPDSLALTQLGSED